MEIIITLKGQDALDYLKYLETKKDEVKVKESKSKKRYKTFNFWNEDDIKMIEYCATTSTPSHRTYDYLKRKLPSILTDDAITSKVYSLGYRVVKGLICQ